MRAIDYIRLLSLAAIWGASFLFMRIASPAIGSINTAFFRVFLGLIGLAFIILMLRKSLAFKGKLNKILILGAINSGIPFLMYSIAATLLPTGYSAILNATTPLTGAMIGFFIFSERLTVKKWLGVTLGIIGITVITTVGDSNIAGHIHRGVAACIIATIGYGFAGFLTRKWITQQGGLDSTLVAFGSQIGATAFLTPFLQYRHQLVAIDGNHGRRHPLAGTTADDIGIPCILRIDGDELALPKRCNRCIAHRRECEVMRTCATGKPRADKQQT